MGDGLKMAVPGSGAAQLLGGLIESKEYPGGNGSYRVSPPLLMILAVAVLMQRRVKAILP